MRLIGWASIISAIHDFWTLGAFVALLAAELWVRLRKDTKPPRRKKRR